MPLKILAIDDSHTLRLFIKNTLEENFPEAETSVARDGREGLVMAQRDHPDLILLDFLMPEMRGDEVCQALLVQPTTARIPVILMSSSAAEIQATQEKCSNVVRAIAKPFTPELLYATINFILRQQCSNEDSGSGVEASIAKSEQLARVASPASEDPAFIRGDGPAFLGLDPSAVAGFTTAFHGRKTSDPVIYRGDTSHIPFRGVLNAIEDEKHTGILRLFLRDQLMLTYVSKGRPVLCTTPNVKLYLRSGTPTLPAACKQWLEDAKSQQAETGKPLFIALAESGSLTKAAVINLCNEYSRRLFARVWLSNKVRFEFLRMQQLPEFTTYCDPYSGNIDEWAMESLRLVGEEALSALAWGESTGIPSYTRVGYERIQQIALLDDEMHFASLVSSNLPLHEIAQQLQISVEKAQQILFRFLCLEIFTYWPASVLRGNQTAA